MIGKYELLELLEKYNIDNKNFISNNNVLTYGEYLDIDETLNYLVNTLKIHRSNIEKCPSIIYYNVSCIKDNIKFLKEKRVSFTDVETCLHVLSTETKQLIETYNYVEENYGIQVINKKTSILSVGKEKIIGIENLKIVCENKDDIISVCIGKNSVSEIKQILQSKEYRDHPGLFTPATLASAKLKDIQDIIGSKEYKDHPELFTSTTLARTSLKDIQDIIGSKEYKDHPELFTSETLAHAKLKDISLLLELDYWSDERYSSLLTSSIVSKSKSMLGKLPILFKMAEYYSIDKYLTTSFLLFSPNQNYALIRYLIDNDLPLVVENKLNPIFGKQPGVLKKKYNIDLKELMEMYSLNEKIKKI